MCSSTISMESTRPRRAAAQKRAVVNESAVSTGSTGQGRNPARNTVRNTEGTSRKRKAGPVRVTAPRPPAPARPAKRSKSGLNWVDDDIRQKFQNFLRNANKIPNANIERHAKKCKKKPHFQGQRGSTRAEHIEWILQCGTQREISELLGLMHEKTKDVVQVAAQLHPASVEEGRQAALHDRKANNATGSQAAKANRSAKDILNNSVIHNKVEELVKQLLAASTPASATQALQETERFQVQAAEEVKKGRSIPVSIPFGGLIIRMAGLPLHLGNSKTAFKTEIPLPELPPEVAGLMSYFTQASAFLALGAGTYLTVILAAYLGPYVGTLTRISSWATFAIDVVITEYGKWSAQVAVLEKYSKEWWYTTIWSCVRGCSKIIAFFIGYFGPAYVIKEILTTLRGLPKEILDNTWELILMIPGAETARQWMMRMGMVGTNAAYEHTLAAYIVNKYPYLYSGNPQNSPRKRAAIQAMAKKIMIRWVGIAMGLLISTGLGLFGYWRLKEKSLLKPSDLEKLPQRDIDLLVEYGFTKEIPLVQYHRLMKIKPLTKIVEAKITGAYLLAHNLTVKKAKAKTVATSNQGTRWFASWRRR